MSTQFYSTPSNQSGGYVVYEGARRQRGAGVFGSFRKFMAPIGRQALQGVKAIAKNKTVQNIAKQAAAKGAEVLTNVAVDALQGRNIGESLKEHSKDVALRTLTGTSSVPTNNNNKRKRKRKASKSKKRAVKQVKRRKSLKQRGKKRSHPPFRRGKIPASKRRKLSRAELNRRDLF